ncbi:MFS transporter [Sphingobium sp. H39-3-25]|uniref:MFS transporter n=1 Tax=Sphingobium arseniciresistens TaxID=3030834 RepID=UPI0023B9022F|nr:MFS transporter [Sphingobium arseniciresistens]
MQELRRGWRPLAASCVGLALGLSPHSAYTIGLIAGPLGEDLGWSRSSVLGATMAATVAVILLGSSVGRLVDRVGARRVALCSTVGVAIGLLLMAATVRTNIAFFYGLWGLLTALGLGTLPMTYAKIATQWFNRSRGLALGLMLASTGIAGAIYPFYIDWWIGLAGWRGAFVGLAILPLAISLPLQYRWLFEAKASDVPDDGGDAVGLTLGQAVRHYRFWAAALAAMLLNAATGGLLTNFLPLLTQAGLTHGQALQALSVLALSVTGGRLLCGFMLDRLWAPVVALTLIVPAIAGTLVLTTEAIHPMVAVGCVTLVGLITGAEFDLMAFITGRYFGRRHYSEIFGLQFAIFAIGSGAAPILFGFVAEQTGNYHALLVLSSAMLAGAGLLFFTLGRYPAAHAQHSDS